MAHQLKNTHTAKTSTIKTRVENNEAQNPKQVLIEPTTKIKKITPG